MNFSVLAWVGYSDSMISRIIVCRISGWMLEPCVEYSNSTALPTMAMMNEMICRTINCVWKKMRKEKMDLREMALL
jgi:hypothetical protein